MTIKISSRLSPQVSDSEAVHGRGRRPFAAAGVVRRAGRDQRVGLDLRRPGCPPHGTLGALGAVPHPGRRGGFARGHPAAAASQKSAAAMQGQNSWPRGQNVGYRGPMPPPGHGTHHYHFKLYALDAKLAADAGLDKPALLRPWPPRPGRGRTVGHLRAVKAVK